MYHDTIGALEIHPHADLYPIMPEDEFLALKADISSQGLLDPITLYEDKILDGRHRYRACQELGIEPRFEMYAGEDALKFVISKNHHRRHLSASQRAAIAEELTEVLAKLAKERQGQRTDLTNIPAKLQECSDVEYGEAAEQAAELAGASARYVYEYKKIKREAPELATKIKQGAIDIQEAKKEVRKQQRLEQRQEMIKANAPIGVQHRYLLCHGDFRNILPTLEKADFIITDPPYPQEYLPLYEDLAKLASENLKEGASLLVMCGQSYLPEIMAMMTKHLNYQWMLAYLTPGGQSAQLWERKVNTFWKPVIWFVKGKYQGEWIGDVTKSGENEKSGHDWGQSTSGMTDLLSRFVFPNALVIDPFCGAGATGLAALALNCQFIGIDTNHEAISIAAKRLFDGC